MSKQPAPSEKSTRRKCWEIFKTYLTSMLFAFTGGNVTLPLLQQQLDDRYHLLDKDKVLENFALGSALPGVISLNAGLLIGRDICGWPGGIAAALGLTLPAFFGMLLIAVSYTFISGVKFIGGAIAGIRAASVAIILTNAMMILGRAKGKFEWALAAAAFVAVLALQINIILVIAGCGLAGVARVVWQRRRGL